MFLCLFIFNFNMGFSAEDAEAKKRADSPYPTLDRVTYRTPDSELFRAVDSSTDDDLQRENSVFNPLLIDLINQGIDPELATKIYKLTITNQDDFESKLNDLYSSFCWADKCAKVLKFLQILSAGTAVTYGAVSISTNAEHSTTLVDNIIITLIGISSKALNKFADLHDKKAAEFLGKYNNYISSLGGKALSLISHSAKPDASDEEDQEDKERASSASVATFFEIDSLNDLSERDLDFIAEKTSKEFMEKISLIKSIADKNIRDQITDRKLWEWRWEKADSISYYLSWGLVGAAGVYGLYSTFFNYDHGTSSFDLLIMSILGASGRALKWMSTRAGKASLNRRLDAERLSESIGLEIIHQEDSFELVIPQAAQTVDQTEDEVRVPAARPNTPDIADNATNLTAAERAV